MKNIIDILSYSLFMPLLSSVKEEAYFDINRPIIKRHIGIILLADIGEKTCFLPVLERIKKAYPRAIIHIFTDEHGYEVFEKNPYMDHLHIVPVNTWRKESPDRIAHTLKSWILKNREHISCVFNFSPSMFSAALSVGLMKDENKRFGLTLDEEFTPVIRGNKWMKFFYYVVYPDIRENPVCSLNSLNKRSMYTLALGIPVDSMPSGSRILFSDFKPENNLPPDRLYIGVSLGAEFNIRRWPEDKFRELIRRIHDEFGADILLLDEEKKEYPSISGFSFVHNFSGHPLKELFYYLSQCRLFVSNHNALIQVSGALSVPTLVVCAGHTKGPEFRGPHVAIRKVVPCSPCYGTECSRMYCLMQLPPEEVFDILKWHMSVVHKSEGIIPYEVPDNIVRIRDMELACSVLRLPEEAYRYVTVGLELNQCVAQKIIDMSYALLWDRANQLKLKSRPLLQQSHILDWIFTIELEHEAIGEFLFQEIEFVREWEDRLAILIVRLQEFMPRPWHFWQRRLDVDPENLLDSLIAFDHGFPRVFIALLDDDYDYEQEEDDVLFKIRRWMDNRKFLLQLIREYRSMLETFWDNDSGLGGLKGDN